MRQGIGRQRVGVAPVRVDLDRPVGPDQGLSRVGQRIALRIGRIECPRNRLVRAARGAASRIAGRQVVAVLNQVQRRLVNHRVLIRRLRRSVGHDNRQRRRRGVTVIVRDRVGVDIRVGRIGNSRVLVAAVRIENQCPLRARGVETGHRGAVGPFLVVGKNPRCRIDRQNLAGARRVAVVDRRRNVIAHKDGNG